MLTDSEREWLEQRDAIQFALDGYRVPGLDGPYEMRPDYEDAAIFEARVAAKLADPFFYEQYPAEIRLMLARLEVEEEMDGWPDVYCIA